ncbi:hypothetical protein L1887_49517 [Cichorium endivia]|nr:hypothetical protein L1887_49517 [Cichorium endivia]
MDLPEFRQRSVLHTKLSGGFEPRFFPPGCNLLPPCKSVDLLLSHHILLHTGTPVRLAARLAAHTPTAMVKDFVHQSSYDHSWSSCVRSYFLRYPNPSASHVLSVDVIDRRIEYRPVRSGSYLTPSSSSVTLDSQIDTIPVLCTTRLILKRGNLPKWAPSGIIKNAESWVMEQSEGRARPLSTQSKRNGAGLLRRWVGVAHAARYEPQGTHQERQSDAELDAQPRPYHRPGSDRGWCRASSVALLLQDADDSTDRVADELRNAATTHRKVWPGAFCCAQGHVSTRHHVDALPDHGRRRAATGLDEARTRRLAAHLDATEEDQAAGIAATPPFLDVLIRSGPWQKLKMWWYSGHYSQVKELQDGYLIERDEDEDVDPESRGLVRRPSPAAMEVLVARQSCVSVAPNRRVLGPS